MKYFYIFSLILFALIFSVLIAKGQEKVSSSIPYVKPPTTIELIQKSEMTTDEIVKEIQNQEAEIKYLNNLLSQYAKKVDSCHSF